MHMLLKFVGVLDIMILQVFVSTSSWSQKCTKARLLTKSKRSRLSLTHRCSFPLTEHSASLVLLIQCALLRITLVPISPSAAAGVRTGSNPLVLLSLDGFRYDYLALFANVTPNLNRLAAGAGAYAAKVKPTYSTKTAANHWSIATGLYQEVHGVVNNQLFDPEFNQTVEMLDNTEERWWNASEPLWLLAEANGLRTGVHQWPGGDVAIGGRLPTYRTPRKAGQSKLDKRLDIVLGWLANGGASLAMVYHHEPDWTAHFEGIEAVGSELADIDAAIGRFLEDLEQLGMRARTNLIITSDHGMLSVNQSRVVRVKVRSHPAARAVVQMDIALGLFAHPGRAGELVAAMRQELDGQQVRVVPREQIPDRLHYRAHRRVPDVLLMPENGYVVADTTDRVWKKGIHGGDNDWDEMQVPLLAVGPAFRAGALVPTGAQQVDIYGMACRLLGLPAGPHNGSEYPLAGLLADKTGVRGPAGMRPGQLLAGLIVQMLLLLLLTS